MQTPWTVRDTLVVLALVLAATLSWAPRTRGPLDFRWDASVYYTLGTSLYQQHSYRLLNEPGEIHATVYPPLLPLIVAGHQALIGTTDPVVVGRWMRGTFWLLLTAYFVLAYCLMRTRLRTPAAAVAVLLCVLQWFPHWLSDRCYADLPFAAVTAEFFALALSRKSSVASGLCAVAAFLLRSAGIALLCAWVAERLLVRDWRSAVLRAAFAALPVLAWQGYVFSVEHGPEYRSPAYAYQRAAYNVYNVSYSRLASLRDHRHPTAGFATSAERAARFFENAAQLPAAIGGGVSAHQEQWEALVDRINAMSTVGRVIPWRAIPLTLSALAALVFIGLLAQLRAGDAAIPVAIAVNAAVVCLMPVSYMYELPRYLAVFAPALVLALMTGIGVLRNHWPGRAMQAAGALTIAAIVIVQTFVLRDLFVRDNTELGYFDSRGHQLTYRLFTYDDISQGQDLAIRWLNDHARPGEIVVSSSPHWIYLRTGLRAVMPPMEADAGEVQRLLDSVPASYVLVEGPGSLGGEYVAPVVKRFPDQWELVVSDPVHHVDLYARRAR